MKKLLLQAALAISACFLAGQSAHATDTNTIVDAIKNRTLLDAKNMDILQKINQQRKACGFNSVKWNPQLADSARKHTNYIAYVQRKRHLRTTEKSPFYNPKPVNWNAHHQRPVSQEFWYHSLVIEGGYGAKRKDLLGKMLEKDTGIMTYPCNNLKVLDTKLDSETPNPLAGIGRDLYKNPVGHPLFIRTDQGVAANPRKILFVNKTNGKKVDYYLLQHKNDPHKILKKNEAFIIPLQPLDKNSIYEVRFTASDKRDKAKEIKLQFKT